MKKAVGKDHNAKTFTTVGEPADLSGKIVDKKSNVQQEDTKRNNKNGEEKRNDKNEEEKRNDKNEETRRYSKNEVKETKDAEYNADLSQLRSLLRRILE